MVFIGIGVLMALAGSLMLAAIAYMVLERRANSAWLAALVVVAVVALGFVLSLGSAAREPISPPDEPCLDYLPGKAQPVVVDSECVDVNCACHMAGIAFDERARIEGEHRWQRFRMLALGAGLAPDEIFRRAWQARGEFDAVHCDVGYLAAPHKWDESIPRKTRLTVEPTRK